MLTTVLFDMGGTLEDIWHNEGTKREALQCVWDTLRAHGLEPEVDFGQFQELILEGIREYKTWCDLEFREKKPEEIWTEMAEAKEEQNNEVDTEAGTDHRP